MVDNSKRKLKRATIIYWMMLTYIVAALVWWFISLERQSDSLADFKYKQLNATVDSTSAPIVYSFELKAIQLERRKKTAMHLSEGLFFLALIVITGVFIFRSVRRQIKWQIQQQNFMMAVTHELKTPIAITRLNLETLQKYQLDPEKQKKLINTALEETSRLNFLTNNILLSSQLEGDGYKNANEELDLSHLLKDCMADFQKRFPDRQFTQNIQDDIDVVGDALLLQLLINNLLENAVKYSPKTGVITAVLQHTGAKKQLVIIDEGPGIPDEEKLNIFEKFYRIGNENTRKAQGTGLGLYLCSKIAQYHNADISVTNHSANGSSFVVNFPA